MNLYVLIAKDPNFFVFENMTSKKYQNKHFWVIHKAVHSHFFLGHFCPSGKGAWGYPYVKHQPRRNDTKDSHNTGKLHALLFSNSVWVLYRPTLNLETCEVLWSPYPRRLESLTICWCNYKGSTFNLGILRPWVFVRPESNSRPAAWQPDAQLIEPPVRCGLLLCSANFHFNYMCPWNTPNCINIGNRLICSGIWHKFTCFHKPLWSKSNTNHVCYFENKMA